MSARWVALLRAVNVGGKGVVKMADVCRTFEEAGCRDVTSFGHAGNVLFTCGPGGAATQQRKVLEAMQSLLGAPTAVCFRRLDDIVDLVARDPFRDVVSDQTLKLYVTFMDREPRPRPKLPIVVEKEAVEITSIHGSDMFIVSRRKPNGMYGFPNQCVEQLGVVATTRNWNTVVKLAALARK